LEQQPIDRDLEHEGQVVRLRHQDPEIDQDRRRGHPRQPADVRRGRRPLPAECDPDRQTEQVQTPGLQQHDPPEDQQREHAPSTRVQGPMQRISD